MTAYDDFLALKRAGISGRRVGTGGAKNALHITTQGHRDGCPEGTGRGCWWTVKTRWRLPATDADGHLLCVNNFPFPQ